MAELKPGDRVRVEFEATVVQAKDAWRQIEVVADGKRETTWVQPGDCTLIEPEIVLPEIPGTIVQVDPRNLEGMRLAFENRSDEYLEGHPWFAGENRCSDLEVMNLCRKYGYRIIEAESD